MLSLLRLRTGALVAVAFLATISYSAEPIGVSQSGESESLSLEEAMNLARINNGVILASEANVRTSDALARASRGAWLPSVTPFVQISGTSSRTLTGPGRGTSTSDQVFSAVDIDWRLLDSGERRITTRLSEISADVAEFNFNTTLLNVMFNVQTRYIEVLRSREVVRVQVARVERADQVLRQVEARVAVGDAPAKDILQARADLLNARADLVRSESLIGNSEANLKALIGWNPRLPLPELEPVDLDFSDPIVGSLDEAFQVALQTRTDLLAQRLRLEAQQENVALARIRTGIQYTVDASFRKAFGPDPFETGSLALNASYPLFDGGQVRERLRAEQFTLVGEEASLEQAELDVLAEVESAYREFIQTDMRLEAASLALEAAKLNYEAAEGANREGAAEIIEVITAQLSLVTAESNFIESQYDASLARGRLLVTLGLPYLPIIDTLPPVVAPEAAPQTETQNDDD